jgi:hypothetical protein
VQVKILPVITSGVNALWIFQTSTSFSAISSTMATSGAQWSLPASVCQPLQLLRLDPRASSTRWTLTPEGRVWLQSAPLCYLPLSIVAHVGELRIGKSTLASLLSNMHLHGAINDPGQDFVLASAGFSVRGGKTAHTEGIWAMVSTREVAIKILY